MVRSLVEQQFGAHARAYATSPVHAKGESLARLVELAAPQRSWAVLDVATGAGHTAAAFAPHVARVVAADITVEMLAEAGKLAAARGLTNVETVRATADALPVAEKSFDAVTCRIAAHHFPDPAAFVREAARVLKPGGVLALDDNIAPDRVLLPGYPAAEIEAAAAAYNAFERKRDPSHLCALTLAEWCGLAEAAGLAIIHTETMTKPMDFDTWARRLGAADGVVAELARDLSGATGALREFLRPAMRDGAPSFVLTEGILIARKPA